LNFSLYIAKRYLKSKKSHNIINLISAISLVGVLFGTMSLIIILSVFNGLEGLVKKYYNSFNSDFVIQATEGKVFNQNTIPYQQIKNIEGVEAVIKVLDEVVLLSYNQKQYICRLKGVDEYFEKYKNFDSLLIDGVFKINSENINYILCGAGVAYHLELNINDLKPIKASYPNRRTTNLNNPLDAFVSDVLLPSGVFSVQTNSDSEYAIVPLKFMQNLTQYDTSITSIEIITKNNANIKNIQKELSNLLGNSFKIKNRNQQEELLYKVMKGEKLIIFIFLAFILFLATFNIIGTLSILIIEKKKDISILITLGANKSIIEKIFIYEGILINLFGGVLGMILGAILCFIQQKFEIIKMESYSDSYSNIAYPVALNYLDFVYVIILIVVLGFISTWLPVKKITNSYYSKIH